MPLRPSVARQITMIDSLRKSIQEKNSATRAEQLVLLENCVNDDCITALNVWLVGEAGVDPATVIREVKLKDGIGRPGAVHAARLRHQLLLSLQTVRV